MGHVVVRVNQCKGCALCVATCPLECLRIGEEINTIGYQHVLFEGEDRCTACGMCFMVCPEPGALTVLMGKEE
ncbi:MAG: 4Fe-4S dicluster domain-containing protein [Sphaerochaetaceae bacterium]|jgi:Pyruvate/2-oxoacid:ferredoxin oxidoreductase delta subunit